MKQIVLIGLCLFGCSAAGDGPGAVIPPLALSPEGVDYDLVQEIAERWQAATGLPVIVQEDGTPVRRAPMIAGGSCGETGVTVSSPHVVKWIHLNPTPDLRCPDWLALLHEIGHAVCEHGLDSDVDNKCHSTTGLMASPIGSTCIDSTSLETVCAYRECAAFLPEC